jgi:hypothetical protein
MLCMRSNLVRSVRNSRAAFSLGLVYGMNFRLQDVHTPGYVGRCFVLEKPIHRLLAIGYTHRTEATMVRRGLIATGRQYRFVCL